MDWQGRTDATKDRDFPVFFMFWVDRRGSEAMSTDSSGVKLARTRRETAESKAETTKRVSEEMLRLEAEQRTAKTARLKAARLAMQEERKAEGPTKKAARSRTAS
jgi:broad specificity phosphatase PhoE